MVKMRAWLQAIRLPTLAAGISPLLISLFLTLKEGGSVTFLFFLLLAFTLCIQIGTNISNDYFDFIKGADTTDRVGPVRVCQKGLLSLEEVRMGFFTAFFTAFCIAFFLSWSVGVWLLALGVVSIILGLAYTAGPYPLGYLGLSELFVLLFFGPIAVGVAFFLQTKIVKISPFIIGIGPGLISCALLVINNLRDQKQDKKAKKNTLVVRFGTLFGFFEYSLCILCPCGIAAYYFPGWTIAFTLLFIAALFLIQGLIRSTLSYRQLLPYTCYFLWIYTALIGDAILRS